MATWLIYTLTDLKDKDLTCMYIYIYILTGLQPIGLTVSQADGFTVTIIDWLTSSQTNNWLALFTGFFDWAGLLSDLLTGLQTEDVTVFSSWSGNPVNWLLVKFSSESFVSWLISKVLISSDLFIDWQAGILCVLINEWLNV